MLLPSGGGGGGGARRGGRPGTVDINGQLLVLFNTYILYYISYVLLCIEVSTIWSCFDGHCGHSNHI